MKTKQSVKTKFHTTVRFPVIVEKGDTSPKFSSKIRINTMKQLFQAIERGIAINS